MSQSGHTSQAANSFSVLRILMVVIPVMAMAFLIYAMIPPMMAGNGSGDRMERTLGLRTPVENRLADRFVDSAGDLVADVPADPAQHLNPDVLIFSYIAEEDSRKSEEERLEIAAGWGEAFSGFLVHLEQVTGRPVEFRPYIHRNAQLSDLRDGKLHITGLNTGSVPFAVNQLGFVPAFTVAAADGSYGHQTAFIVQASSRYKSVTDLKGAQVTLTRPGSNSGYTFPLLHLRDHGFDLNRTIRPDILPVLSFSHTASIEGVADGRYTAAAVATDVLDHHPAMKAGKIRVIDRSSRFPGPGLGWAHNLEPELAAKIREAFSTFVWDDSLKAQFAGWGGFEQFFEMNYASDWAFVRSIDDRFGIDHEMLFEQLGQWVEPGSAEAQESALEHLPDEVGAEG